MGWQRQKCFKSKVKRRVCWCGDRVAMEMSLPSSPSLESESDGKKRQKAREEEDEVCGRGGDKEDKRENKANLGGC